MITLTWTVPQTDSSPLNPAETVSGLKEIRVLRAPLLSAEYDLLATLAPTDNIYQNTAYSDGRFAVVVVDHAGNESVLAEIEHPIADRTPPPPISNLAIVVTATPPPTTVARVDAVTVDLTGADFTIIDNDTGLTTLIEYLDDSLAGVYGTVTTLAAGVTAGRLNKTWTQGTHTFVCLRARQGVTTTESQCRPLSQLFGSTAQLLNVTVAPNTIAGGNSATGTVTLTAAAPSGGLQVGLVSNQPSVLIVPSSVTVPQGQASVNFAISTVDPPDNANVTVTASYGSQNVIASGIVVESSNVPKSDWSGATALTLINTHNFTSGVNGDGWNSFPGGAVIDDATAPTSPPKVFRFTYPQGYVGGSSPGQSFLEGFVVNSEIYLYFEVKFSGPPYDNHVAGTKTIFLWHNSFQEAFTPIFYGNGPSLTCQIYNPSGSGISNGHVAGTWGDDPGTRQFPCGGSIPLGAWNKIEMYVKRSTTQTSRNGILMVRFNGVEVANYTNINTRSEGWNIVDLSPTYGGTGQSKVQTDTVDFDHIILRGI